MKGKLIPYLWVAIISGILLSLNMGGLSIYALDEAKNASCAREMWESEEWIVPTFNGELRTDKPPLHYYFMGMAYEFFGVNEWAARLFSMFFGVGTILLVFIFTERYINRQTAWWAAVVIWASLHFAIQFHMAVPDPYLIFWLTAAHFTFFAFNQENKRIYLYLCFVAIGLGVLTKGPMAIALPGLVMLLFLWLSGRLSWKTVWKHEPWTGVIIVALVAVPWYYLVHQKTGGEWTEGFFFKHNLNRFSKTMEGHGGIFLLTFVYVLAGMLPYTVYLPQAIARAWQQRKEKELLLFALIVLASFTGFFAISSTKLPNYTVPVYPFVAVLIGYLLQQSSLYGETKISRWKISLGIYLFVMLILPLGVYFGLPFEPALAHLNYLAWAFFALPVGAVLAWYFMSKGRAGNAHYAMMASWIFTSVMFFYYVFPQVDKENPVTMGTTLIKDEPNVAYFQRMNPAFVFYRQDVIPGLENSESVDSFFNRHPQGYMITQKSRLKNIDTLLNLETIMEQRDLLERPTSVILRKNPTPQDQNRP